MAPKKFKESVYHPFLTLSLERRHRFRTPFRVLGKLARHVRGQMNQSAETGLRHAIRYSNKKAFVSAGLENSGDADNGDCGSRRNPPMNEFSRIFGDDLDDRGPVFQLQELGTPKGGGVEEFSAIQRARILRYWHSQKSQPSPLATTMT